MKPSKGFHFKFLFLSEHLRIQRDSFSRQTVRQHQLLSINYFLLPEVLKRSPPSRSDLV